MANNDMEVIMYKILSYMYECMKAGKRPRMEDICHSCQMFQIPFDEGRKLEYRKISRHRFWRSCRMGTSVLDFPWVGSCLMENA